MNTGTHIATDQASLLRQSVNLRRLAQRLVSVDEAEDVAQEGFLKLFQHRQRGRDPQIGWLRTTVRNAAAELHRSKAHRLAREQARAEPAAAPASDEAVARLEAMKLVVQCLAELPEPNRSTLTRLFIDDERPEQIARTDGVSVNAIHQRKKRGLEMMRAELDQQGGREHWLQALAPLVVVRPKSRIWPWPLSEAPVAWLLAAVTLLGVGAAYGSILRSPAPQAVQPTSVQAHQGEPATVIQPAERTSATEARPIELLVREQRTGRALPNAEVRVWSLPPSSENDPRFERSRLRKAFAHGHLERELLGTPLVLAADASGRAQLQHDRGDFVAIASSGEHWGWKLADSNESSPIVVEVRQDFELGITVQDPDGRPVPGALVALSALGYFREDFVASTTDGRGHSVLPHAGFVKASATQPAAAVAGLRVRVVGATLKQHLRTDIATRSQTLRFADPIGYAEVRLVDATTRIPLPGTHSFTLNGLEFQALDGRALVPVRIGEALSWNEDECELLDRESLPQPASPGEVVRFTLAPWPYETPVVCATIRGRLLGTNGRPLPARDLRLKGQYGRAIATTDSSGRFEFEGQTGWPFSQGFDLDLIDEQRKPLVRCAEGLRLHSEGVTELGDVVVKFGTPLAQGRVVTSDGRGIAGARVNLECTPSVELAGLGYLRAFETTTGADGRFEFPSSSLSSEAQADITLIASHSSFGTTARVVGLRNADVSLVLERPRTITGRVLLDPSVPTSAVWVEASLLTDDSGEVPRFWMTDSSVVRKTARVDEAGHFALPGVGTGTHRFRVLYYGSEAFWSGHGISLYQTDVELIRTMSTSLELEPVDLRGAYHCMNVTLVDSSSKGIQDVTLGVSTPDDYWDCETDKDGKALAFVPRGARVETRSPRYFNHAIDARVGEARVELEPRPRIDLEFPDGFPDLPAGFDWTLAITPENDPQQAALELAHHQTSFLAPARSDLRIAWILEYGDVQHTCHESVLPEVFADTTVTLSTPEPDALADAIEVLRNVDR